MSKFTPSDIAKQNELNSKFWKIKNGEELRGYFLTNEFDKKPTEFNDPKSETGKKIVIKYAAQFKGRINSGEEMQKEFAGSGTMIEEMFSRATKRELNFTDAIFSIERKGEGLGTEYIIDVLGKKDNPVSAVKEVFQNSKELKDDNVPF
jgi:hypothetical protein